MKHCEVCSTETLNKCSNCNQIYYCSTKHQKQDWKNHRNNCHPYKIDHNEELGRFLISTRNIKPFEIVLKEAPLVFGPAQITGPVCLGCLNKIEPSDYVECESCGWLFCGKSCLNNIEHKFECDITSKRGRKVNIGEFISPHPLYQSLCTLRCLGLRNRKPESWARFQELESLDNKRKGSNQWKADYETVGKFIPKFFKTTEFDEEDIMRCIGILQINGHEVPTTDPPHVAVYYTASLLEHSCVPNLAKTFTKEGHLILSAPKAIKKNSHLSICYTDAVWGTGDRQRHLMHTKLFRCSCFRCIDVTELGTYYSALKCCKCGGFYLPSNLMDWTSNWACSSCHHLVDYLYISSNSEKASTDLQIMEKTSDNCSKYISHYSKWLSEKHYHISEVKILLAQHIGKDPKELLTVSEEKLMQKITYCKELIELYEKLAPCEIRLLGILCFELHSALAEHTRRISLKVNVPTKQLLEESFHYVEKCVNYLQYECEHFIEGHILKQAKINRDAIKLVIQM